MSSYITGLSNISEVQETRTREYYPITLSEAKRHLRIDNTYREDDDYLTGLIEAATVVAENFIEKSIAKTLVEVRINEFSGDWIRINDGNFISIVSVLNASDVSTGTIEETSKHFDFFQIKWTSQISSDPIKINYYAGYNENACPNIIKQAILIIIANLYDSQRSSVAWSGYLDNKIWQDILSFYKAKYF